MTQVRTPDEAREHHRERKRRWRQANPDKIRAKNLRVKYGITIEDFDNMVISQSGRCAICGTKTSLVVDHCHATGRVRGLLCGPCNRGIGHLRDDPARVRAAFTYLEAE